MIPNNKLLQSLTTNYYARQIAADASQAAVIGHPHQISQLQIHSVIAGRYPLVFGEVPPCSI